MLEPNAQISVTLNATQWNAVLMQLAEGPYRVVASLMQTIAAQCEAHSKDGDNLVQMPSARPVA